MSDYSVMMEKAQLYDAGVQGQLLVDAKIADGSAVVSEPSYQHLTIASINSGSSATVDGNGDLVLNAKGQPLTLEWRISVTQKNNAHVFFGYAWDGGSIKRTTQELIGDGSMPVFAMQRLDLVAIGDTLALYISSDWQNQATAWSGGELMIVGSSPLTLKEEKHE